MNTPESAGSQRIMIDNYPDHDVVVSVRDLTMSYGATEVLTGVGFEISRGEVVCLLGPNGAGKTTTIEILEGFRSRSGGDVEVLGEDPARASEEWRARTGVVLQSWRDHARWSPHMLLDHLGGYYAPYSTAERPRPVDATDLLDLVGLSDRAHQKIATLSGGQRRRLDVAVGIIGRPELLFLDEPTAGLDPQARRDFHDLIHRLADMDGTTILLTTHDLDEAERLADRVLMLAGGQIVADDSPEALALRFADDAEVRWTVNGERFVHAGKDTTEFVRELLNREGDVRDLEVKRARLEEAYLALVRQHESGSVRDAAAIFARMNG